MHNSRSPCCSPTRTHKGPTWKCCLGVSVLVVVQYAGVQVYNDYPFKSSEQSVSFALTANNMSVFMPLFTKFSLSNGLEMFTAWPYWFSLVQAKYSPTVGYRTDQGNQRCALEIRAELGRYQLQASFLHSALWEHEAEEVGIPTSKW